MREIEKLVAFPANANPYHHDSYNMGQAFSKEWHMMYKNHTTESADWVIFVHIPTGKRFKLYLNEVIKEHTSYTEPMQFNCCRQCPDPDACLQYRVDWINMQLGLYTCSECGKPKVNDGVPYCSTECYKAEQARIEKMGAEMVEDQLEQHEKEQGKEHGNGRSQPYDDRRDDYLRTRPPQG